MMQDEIKAPREQTRSENCESADENSMCHRCEVHNALLAFRMPFADILALKSRRHHFLFLHNFSFSITSAKELVIHPRYCSCPLFVLFRKSKHSCPGNSYPQDCTSLANEYHSRQVVSFFKQGPRLRKTETSWRFFRTFLFRIIAY